MDSLELIYSVPKIGMTIGIALLGASAFWGAIFMYKTRHGDKDKVWHLFGVEMLSISFFGSLFLAVSYWSSFTLHQKLQETNGAVVDQLAYIDQTNLFIVQFPILVVGLLVLMIGVLFIKRQTGSFSGTLEKFYLTLLIIVSLFAFSDWINIFNDTGFFQSLLQLSGIFVFGTMAVIGHIYIRARKDKHQTKVLFPFLHVFSKVIWFGIGLQVLVILLSPMTDKVLSDEFSFYQILLGLLIMLGAILSGPVAKQLGKDRKVSQKTDFSVLTFGALASALVFLMVLVQNLNLYLWSLEQLVLSLVVSVILALFGVLVAEYDN